VYDSLDDLDAIFATTRDGYVYPRYGSPTVTAFEEAIANLEGGEAAFALASGMAAIHVALLAAGVKAGTTIVAALDLYGATFALVNRLMAELGAQVHFVDVTDPAAVEAALAEARPVALLAETISNPLIKVADVPALAQLAHRHGAQLLIDNTFASPYLFNPLAHSADYVIHSATKYIGGHGDVMAGVVVTSAENRRKLYELNKLVGSVLGPFEAWLALRGVKTLPLRVRQQCANAARIAKPPEHCAGRAWEGAPTVCQRRSHRPMARRTSKDQACQLSRPAGSPPTRAGAPIVQRARLWRDALVRDRESGPGPGISLHGVA
jgi:cystathionine gamma-synthase/methionine-gamma-lyase